MLERAPALRKRAQPSHQKVRQRVARDVPGKAVGPVLEEQIVLIEPCALECAAHGETVPSLDPADGVVPVERGAREDRVGERAEAEVTRHTKRLYCLGRRLIDI